MIRDFLFYFVGLPLIVWGVVMCCGFVGAGLRAAEKPSQQATNPQDLVRNARAALDAVNSIVDRIQAGKDESRQDHEQHVYSVSGKNFVVQAFGRSFSECLLKRADILRASVALEHLKKELPEGKDFAIICVEITDDTEEECDVVLCGKGRRIRGDHRIWITAATKDRAVELLEQAIATVVCGERTQPEREENDRGKRA